jgi:hypothetical protein
MFAESTAAWILSPLTENENFTPNGAVAMCVGICWRGLRWDEDTGSGSQVNRLFSKVLV